MLTCFALIALATTSLSGIPTLAGQVEAEARELNAETQITPAFIADLHTFSGNAMVLSDSLRAAGVAQDLPCIFRGISQDTEVRAAEFENAHTDTERTMAFNDLHALLSDAILIAPMAAGAAADLQSAQAAAGTSGLASAAPPAPTALTETADRR